MTATPNRGTTRTNALRTFEQSRKQIERNSKWMPGGVSSNFRLNIAPTPLVFERGEGAILVDADGNELIDYYLGMGPMILGHKPPALCEAVTKQLEKGILFAGQTEIEAEAARLVCERVPCAEQVRFNTSGSEAIQAALRIARAATGRSRIVKFEGHYHGWFDNVLWSVAPSLADAGDGDAPTRVPASTGQLPEAGDALDVLPWNDLALLEARLARGDVAAVIMEPAMCNAGAIAPGEGYLEGVRAACSASGTILIFDEVITGFRLAAGGAQERFNVTPDLATFGKAIANGFAVAAVAGRSDLMELCVKGVLHGGTYNSQPISMAATVATLRSLTPELYARIAGQGDALQQGFKEIFSRRQVTASVTGFGQFVHVGFGLERPARNYRDLLGIDKPAYVEFCQALLARGVRALERGAWFLSSEHDAAVIARTLDAADDAVRALKESGRL